MDILLWHEILEPYELAVKELQVKFRHLIKEHHGKGLYSPIESVSGRVKSVSSILEKMQRKGIVPEEMEEQVEDIAGIRIICQFVEDIEKVADLIRNRSDMQVVTEKDYINHMKSSGYRSYHMIIEIPVFFSDSKKPIRVEVQIRTIAMDFWASLDHQLKYKKSFVDLNGEISGELKQCADVIAQTDNKMLEIRKRIEAQGVTVSRD